MHYGHTMGAKVCIWLLSAMVVATISYVFSAATVAQSVRVCTTEESGPDANGVIRETTICPTDSAQAARSEARTGSTSSQQAATSGRAILTPTAPPTLEAVPDTAPEAVQPPPVASAKDESIIEKVVDSAPLPIKLFAKAVEALL